MYAAEKTVQKYEQLGQEPSELKQARTHRTRLDPFEADWAELEKKLEEAPELEAKALFEWLCEREGAKYQEGAAAYPSAATSAIGGALHIVRSC